MQILLFINLPVNSTSNRISKHSFALTTLLDYGMIVRRNQKNNKSICQEKFFVAA
ncbi:hypothetical protein [Clostridium sp. YIM B02500]|uniref:hypothetical protein n=1 Tax=Clostridium sp. YIM B02500 TaxID=2910681 RepID=UPI001EED71B5|nr:hypothetical protein [Clostridium sp. YIM B02500]